MCEMETNVALKKCVMLWKCVPLRHWTNTWHCGRGCNSAVCVALRTELVQLYKVALRQGVVPKKCLATNQLCGTEVVCHTKTERDPGKRVTLGRRGDVILWKTLVMCDTGG